MHAKDDMKEWLDANDPDGSYRKLQQSGEQLLHGFQKTRDSHNMERIDAFREGNRLQNQADVPPETIPAYVETKALQKRAENEAAANDVLIAEFIKTIQVNTMRPVAPQSNGAGRQAATSGKKPPSGTGGAKTPVVDTLFAKSLVANGFDYVKEHPELVYPSKHYRAALLERTTLPALRVGTPVPILNFSGPKSFDTLGPPRGYYVMIAEHADGSIRMALGYETPGENLPQVLIFEKTDTPFTILALSDTALRGGMINSYILDNLRKIHSPLIAPDTPMSARLPEAMGGGGGGYPSARDQNVKSTKAFGPLRRALHFDSGKFQQLTQHMAELKLTDPALAVNIRNMSCAPALNGIVALQSDNIPHLMGFNFCVELDFSGSNNKLDAINLYTFMPEMVKFETLYDIRKAVETMKRTYMLVMMEDSRSPHPHWGRIFNRLLDLLQEIDPLFSIEDLDIKFTAWKLNSLIAAWSGLYKGDLHANKTQEQFTRINEEALQFNPIEWQDQYRRMCASKVPPQKVPPRKASEDRYQKRRPETPARETQDGGAGRKKPKNRGRQIVAVTPPPAATPAAAAAPPTQHQQEICVKTLFHKADATLFPGSCKPGCNRQHNPRLQKGKLTPGDKAAVKASLDAMTGKFATLALQELDRLF